MNDSVSTANTGQGTARSSRYYLWVVLPLVSTAAMAQGLIRVGFPVLYPFIQTELGLSRAQVGLITSALAIGFAAMALVAGWLTDTLGVKRMIIMSLLSMAAVTLAFPLVFSFPVLLALVALITITASPVYPATTAAIMDWIPFNIRGLAMGIKQMGIPVGGALTAMVLPALALSIGWRMSAAATGLVVLVTAVAFILLYHDAPRSIKPTGKLDIATLKTTLKTILRNRDLVITLSWGSALVGFQFIVLSYFVLFLIEEMGLSPVMAGGLLAIAQVSSIFARAGWGAVSDFIFHGRRIMVLAFTGFLTVAWMAGISLLGAGVHGAIVYLITIVIGISTLSFHGVLATLVGEQSEAGQIGMTIGVSGTVYSIIQTIMPPVFGYLVDITNSYSMIWRITAVAALVCTLGFLVFGREPQRR